MRGGALCPAARLLWCLLVSAVSPLGAQAPVRTRDVGFATVDYSNGLTLGALTLTETLALERASGSLFATGLVSLFNDGRWSMQGGLTGSRFSAPIAAGGILRPWFRAVRGELSLNTTSTAQQGFMPTLQLLTQARLHLLAERQRRARRRRRLHRRRHRRRQPRLHPAAQQRKQQSFNRLWHSDETVRQMVGDSESYGYDGSEPLERLSGTHPAVMKPRIEAVNWHFSGDPAQARWSWKDRVSHFFEQLTGWRPGEYRNYKLLDD